MSITNTNKTEHTPLLKTRRDKLDFITKMLETIKKYQTTFEGKDLSTLPDHELDHIINEIMQLEEMRTKQDLRFFQYLPLLKSVFTKAKVRQEVFRTRIALQKKPVYKAKPGQPLHKENPKGFVMLDKLNHLLKQYEQETFREGFQTNNSKFNIFPYNKPE